MVNYYLTLYTMFVAGCFAGMMLYKYLRNFKLRIEFIKVLSHDNVEEK